MDQRQQLTVDDALRLFAKHTGIDPDIERRKRVCPTEYQLRVVIRNALSGGEPEPLVREAERLVREFFAAKGMSIPKE